jgi:hypothetical protein
LLCDRHAVYENPAHYESVKEKRIIIFNRDPLNSATRFHSHLAHTNKTHKLDQHILIDNTTRTIIMSPRATTMDYIVSSTKSTHKPQKHKRKRVHFSPELPFSVSSDLTREEVKSLWYDAQTLSTFKNNVRKLVFSGSLESKLKDENDNTQGLESCTVERQLQRHRTIQCILSSCKKGYTPEQTADMAEQCSTWNWDVAILQACFDFFEVYQPSMPLPEISNTNTPPACFPFEFEHKRAANSSNGQPQRRVR